MSSPGASETLFDTIDRAAECGLLYLSASDRPAVSDEITGSFDHQLSTDELRAVRRKLDEAGVCLLTYRIDRVPTDETACRQIVGFARRMGIETLIAPPPSGTLDAIEKLCDDHDIGLAIDAPQDRTALRAAARTLRDRSRRIGLHGDINSWIRAGIDPIRAVRRLRDRLITIGIAGSEQRVENVNDKIGSILEEVNRLGIAPVMFGVECGRETTQARENIASFNRKTLQLADGGA